jgi:hypothetical protein
LRKGINIDKVDNSVEAIVALQLELNAITARQGIKMERRGDDVRSIIAWQDEMNAITAREGLKAASKIEDATGPYRLVNEVPLW